jgi:CBS domain containing-hemolysin-like protein
MWIFSLLLVIFFFFLSAFFSGIETGFISLDRFKMEQLAKKSKKQKEILHFLETPERLFGTTLLGTNISNVVVSSLGIYLFHQWSENGIITISEQAATLVIGGLILIFGEIIPKAVYREKSSTMVPRFFPLLLLFDFLFKPFVKIVRNYNRLITKSIKLSSREDHSHFTKEDISYMLEATEDNNALPKDQRDMLEEVLEFTELKAENVMVHRTEIKAIAKDTPIDEIIKLAREEGYTRFPVYEENLDNIVGILIIYDIFKKKDTTGMTAADFIREAYFAPENMDVQVLLTEMQNRKKSMVIIVDSYGGTAGLVTTEDILEEIVGEIEDEYDEDEKEVKKIDNDNYIVQGFVELDYLNDTYQMNLPECDYETIAGLIIHRLARIPATGSKLKVGEWQIIIQQVTPKKIVQVKMKRLPTVDAGKDKQK